VLSEIGVLASSFRGGWSREKLASWRWLVGHRDYLRQRRAAVSAHKSWASSRWTEVVVGEMHIPGEFGLRVPGFVNWVFGVYWRIVHPYVK